MKGLKRNMTMNNKQNGAVSLFVVVFTTLLITIITIGFVSLMIKDQQDASATDLSQSAYDSAQSGVEDAKRAIARYRDICNSGGDCSAAADEINSQTCNAAVEKLSDVKASNNEVAIQANGTSNTLNQAYTCTKINLNTNDYLGKLSTNESNIIPLTGESAFDTIQVEWFDSNNLDSTNGFNIDLQKTTSTELPLLPQTSWKPNTPAILQTQLMQVSSNGFKLSDFDNTNASSQSNANTLFLYPVGNTGTANSTIDEREFVNRDIRKTAVGSPLPISCSGSLISGGYACSAKLKLPVPINGGDRSAYLRLSALYNSSNYRITLLNGTVPVKFSGVQPEIDSTGRASDLFRRVVSRVVMFDANFAYPDVMVTGNVCKNFVVTADTKDYKNDCNP